MIERTSVREAKNHLHRRVERKKKRKERRERGREEGQQLAVIVKVAVGRPCRGCGS